MKTLNKPALVDDYIREFVGKHGFTLMPPPTLELPSDLYFGEVGECFANCLLQALSSKGKYLYCEGLGICQDEAYVHAWLTDKDHTWAYDLTWRAITKSGKIVAAPAYYKGVVLDTEAVKDYIMSTHTAGVIPNREARPRLYKKVLERSKSLWAQ